MTVTVGLANDEPGRGVTPRPAVVAFNCATAAEYLRENEVLIRLGLNLVRFDIQLDLNYTSIQRASEHMGEIHRIFGDLTWIQMDSKVRDPYWLSGRNAEFIDAAVEDHFLKSWYDPAQVKVVLVHADLLQGDGNVVQQVLERLYPDATFFGVGHQLFGSRPQRLGVRWTDSAQRSPAPADKPAPEAPLCMTCGTKMRPAGSTFVCEGCGSTKAIAGPRTAPEEDHATGEES